MLGAAGLSPLAAAQRRTAPRAAPPPRRRLETLASVQALPAEIVGAFRTPVAFEQADSGQYFVFDRMGHAVYGVDAAMQGAWKIVQIGHEVGRIIEPTAFALAPSGQFAVADRPAAAHRLQFFGPGGNLTGGFRLASRPGETVVLDSLVLNGISSLQYDGRSVIVSLPETGSLFTEYSPQGEVLRAFGELRRTGHEDEEDLHLALNVGLPLVNPAGGFYFVFQSGVPLFRKYDAGGRLLLERHVEGVEVDAALASMPSRWPTRRAGDRQVPMVPPTVRTARPDRAGRLWVCLASAPVAYVYDPSGDKARTVQFRAAGLVSPRSLFFARSGRVLVAPGCYEFEP